jgi:plasmid stability protein
VASITIRNLDDAMKGRLKVRAARHGWSMEEAARSILRAALAEGAGEPTSLYAAIRQRIEALGGVELKIPRREKPRDAPTLD